MSSRGLKVYRHDYIWEREGCVKESRGFLGAAKPQYRQYVKMTVFPKVHEQDCVNYKIKSKQLLIDLITLR